MGSKSLVVLLSESAGADSTFVSGKISPAPENIMRVFA
jgi:hypothetical protein